MPTSRDAATQRVYRGIHAGHATYAAALTGVVVPGDVNGVMTPEQHNLRDASALSPFTSWTELREVAENFGRSKGPGGLLLSLPVGAPNPGDRWEWIASPDMWLEREVLLRGVRIGAEVIRL